MGDSRAAKGRAGGRGVHGPRDRHSLIDMVFDQDEKHQGPLLAHIVGSLADEYLKRRGLIQRRRCDRVLLPPGFQDFDPHPGISKKG